MSSSGLEAESWLARELIWYIDGILEKKFISEEPLATEKLNEIKEKIRLGSNKDADGGIKEDALNHEDCLILKKVLKAVYFTKNIDITAFLMPFDYIINEKLGENYNMINEYKW